MASSAFRSSTVFYCVASPSHSPSPSPSPSPLSSYSSSSTSLVFSSPLRRGASGLQVCLLRQHTPSPPWKFLQRTRTPSVAVRAASQVEAASSTPFKEIVPDTEFSIFKTSLGTIGLGVGVVLLSYGFGAYFNILPGTEWSAIMLTYGFPLAIIGMALKYAELKPVPCTTYADALALRETGATSTLKQVKSDVTRFRYGDEQHLDEALKRIFRYGQGGGIQRRNAPVLRAIREEVSAEGKYTLVLVFGARALELQDFVDRQAKFSSFFGPGVTAEIAAGGEKTYEVKLVADGGSQR